MSCPDLAQMTVLHDRASDGLQEIKDAAYELCIRVDDVVGIINNGKLTHGQMVEQIRELLDS